MDLRKTLLIFTVASLYSVALYSQTTYPEGVYMSQEELVNKKPSQNYELLIEQRGDGFSHKVKRVEKNVKPKVIRKKIWAISTGDTLYVNGYNIEFDYGSYFKVEHEGKYLLYQGGVPAGDAALIAYGGGIVGTAIAGMAKWLYAWNPKTGDNYKINKGVLEDWLKEMPQLLKEYKREPRPKDMEVIIQYASLRNEAYEQEQ